MIRTEFRKFGFVEAGTQENHEVKKCSDWTLLCREGDGFSMVGLGYKL